MKNESNERLEKLVRPCYINQWIEHGENAQELMSLLLISIEYSEQILMTDSTSVLLKL